MDLRLARMATSSATRATTGRSHPVSKRTIAPRVTNVVASAAASGAVARRMCYHARMTRLNA